MSPGAIVYFRVLAGFFAEIPPDAGEENKISDLTQREREREKERERCRQTNRPTALQRHSTFYQGSQGRNAPI
jgi:hypothetical protein